MNKPNIILIVLDTVRAKNLSCYGYHRNTTPHLDGFCSESNFFKNSFASGIWTIPSHASIFTGTYPSRHGALNLHRILDNRHITIAELLSSNGYDTIAFSNNSFISYKEFGFNRGFDLIKGPNYPEDILRKCLYKGRQWLSQSFDSGAYTTNQFVNEQVKIRKVSQKPFFLFLNYMEAHAPYVKTQKRFLDMYLGTAEKRKFKNIKQDRQGYLTRSIDITEDEFEILRSVYDSQISYLDSRLKQLFEILKYHDSWDNSIIIITSDHGDLIGEHNLMHHSYSVNEELIKIPMAIKLPGKSENRKEYDSLVSLVDVLPSVTDVLEINDDALEKQIQGHNLFANIEPFKREYVFIECERPNNEFLKTYPDFDFSVYDRQLLTIRSKKYKYVWASNNKHELFNLEDDPSEQVNLIEKMPLLAAEMDKKLFDWYESYEKAPIEEKLSEETLNPDIKKQLEALGYF